MVGRKDRQAHVKKSLLVINLFICGSNDLFIIIIQRVRCRLYGLLDVYISIFVKYNIILNNNISKIYADDIIILRKAMHWNMLKLPSCS